MEKHNFIKVADLSEVPENERLYMEISGKPIVLINLSGVVYAFGDVCTHDNGPLGDGEIDGYEIVCPRHGARFDIRTGKATRAPAFRDIPTFPVKIEDGSIMIGIPKEPPA